MLRADGRGLNTKLCDGRLPVRPSVCPVHRQQHRRAAGLLLGAGAYSRYRLTAAGAGAQRQMRVASCREPTEEAQHRLVKLTQ